MSRPLRVSTTRRSTSALALMSKLRVSCSKAMLIDSSHGGNCTNQRNTQSYSSWTDKPRVAKTVRMMERRSRRPRTVNSMLRPDHSLQQELRERLRRRVRSCGRYRLHCLRKSDPTLLGSASRHESAQAGQTGAGETVQSPQAAGAKWRQSAHQASATAASRLTCPRK